MKKIAVNTIKSFLKEHKREDMYTENVQIADSSFQVTYHTDLTIEEKSAFINRVLSGCFDISGRFRPEYVTPVFRATILQVCTNIPAIAVKHSGKAGAPELDLNAMNDLYQALGMDRLGIPGYQDMVDELNQLCQQAIDWKKSVTLSQNSINTDLHHLLNALAAKVESINTEELIGYASSLSKSTKGLEEDSIVNKLIELSRYHGKSDVEQEK